MRREERQAIADQLKKERLARRLKICLIIFSCLMGFGFLVAYADAIQALLTLGTIALIIISPILVLIWIIATGVRLGSR